MIDAQAIGGFLNKVKRAAIVGRHCSAVDL